MSLLSDSLCRILLHKTESGRLGSRRFSPPKSRFGGEKGVSISLTGQCLASPRTGFCQRKPKRFLIPVTHHSAFSKRLVIGQKIWYHTGVKEEGESRVSRHSLDPPQPVWTRLERIQQLGVDLEYPGKAASSRWHVTSHHFPSLVSLVWVTRKGAHA